MKFGDPEAWRREGKDRGGAFGACMNVGKS